MRAIVTYPPTGGLELANVSQEAGNGVLVRTLYTGICGTDKELVLGRLKFARPQKGHALILGHEALGRVVDPGDSGSFKNGDLVVPMVRRPGGCRMCRMGRQDYCEDGDFVEAGIRGKDGFMRDEFFEEENFLVKVDESTIGKLAVLTEPLKNAMKIREIFRFMESRVKWNCDDSTLECRNIYIFGTGTEGLLISSVFKTMGMNVIAVNRHPLDEGIISFLDRNGIGYLDTSSETLESRVKREKMDAAVDAVGAMDVFKGITDNIQRNGIVILFGTNGQLPSSQYDIIGEIVDKNLSICGSVDGAKIHYNEAVEFIENYGKRFGLESIITGVYEPEDLDIFTKKEKGEIKKVIKWS